MRILVLLAGLAFVFFGVLPHMQERLEKPAESKQSIVASVVENPVAQSSRSVTLARDTRGHFFVNARVGGRRLDLMVDTGASTIALTAADARKLGIHPTPRDFTISVSTANGVARAAPVQLSVVEVGGLVVRDVRALVAAEGALSGSLLGMSFLSKLRRFEYANGRLILEQ